MQKYLLTPSKRLIRFLFAVLFGLTVYFALTSPNLIVGDNAKTGSGTTLVTSYFIILMVGLLVGLFAFPHFHDWFTSLFTTHRQVTAPLLMLFVIAFQVLFVAEIHPAIGFDVDAIHQALTNHGRIIQSYFSFNFNNMPMLLLEHGLAVLFGTTSWQFFDFVTLFLVDASAFLNLLSIYVLDKRHVVHLIYIQAAWLLVFPMIVVPYTDMWVLPLVSAYLLCYLVVRNPVSPVWLRILAGLGFGLFTAGAYILKPSAIVPVVAILIVTFWEALQTKPQRHQLLGGSLIFLGLAAMTSASFMVLNHQVTHEKYLWVNQSREIPAIHFASMGASGQGGYNAKDALKMAELPNKQARVAYSKRMLIQRLRHMGPIGYAAFLYRKQRNDTADGTFAWIKEGHFIKKTTKPFGHGLARLYRNFVYLYGPNLGDFRYIAQLVWVVLLMIILFNWRAPDSIYRILRLGILGGFMYLLLFEGGRSRYLIQFLPLFLLFAGLSASDSWRRFKGLFTWVDLKD
ncbi:integral membrane protein [Lactobacillus selangorensis]|uniref:Integral membrane protein n=1 Tax=Lactobacillus selangorensis TaxID=81857 RepID=A0A0R2FMW1_9LACO|nr:TIGR03766 family XrtG-associated glycosyltransferase [Lactobacillus selangorensis]KRN27288.1 integral membrane protein [Lactobacillus selangorensis]KRN29929.1 integral membrane protein [Lactobacillus selangorensis]